MKRKEKGFSKRKIAVTGMFSVILFVLLLVVVALNQGIINKQQITPELARAMTYEKFQEGEENVEGTGEDVKFSAFFLRDLNTDGYAEKLKGTAKEIGEEDTLYMEVNVNAGAHLKDGKIEINGQNFYLQTALIKDEQLQDNYISNNTREIKLNDIANGSQKLLTGVVRSGDYSYQSTKTQAIGKNFNNYSRNDNEIILTGKYVAEDGTEKDISKKIYLTMDWYGTTYSKINSTSQTYNDIKSRVDDKNKTFTLDFEIQTEEVRKQLQIKENHVEAEIPTLNGYEPISVRQTRGSGESTYDETTRKIIITNTAKVTESGEIETAVDNQNTYGVSVEYPLEAYESIDVDTVSIRIPIKTYYEGFNNPNTEFENPYKSNVASTTIIANYANFPESGTVARFFVDLRSGRANAKNIIPKDKPTKIYNGESAEEKDDTYLVEWTVSIGKDGGGKSITMKETAKDGIQQSDQFIKTNSSRDSMEDITSNIGINFSNANNFLRENGWIKIYDDETGNLIATFEGDSLRTKAGGPYMFEKPIKHVRLETSNTASGNSLDNWMSITFVKELDDEYITTHYTKEEFDNLEYIETTMTGYLDGEQINTVSNEKPYEAKYSTAIVKIGNYSMSTQTTQKNEKITIEAQYNASKHQKGWINGEFLVRLPEGVLTTKINNVEISNNNVSIVNYELIKKDGINFIKIDTKNENNKEEKYNITIDLDITPDPRRLTTKEEIELYAINGVASDYESNVEDQYDLNNNGNTTEKVLKDIVGINFIAPNSLLTNQTISNYDDKGSTVVSPEIVDLKQNYASVNNEERKATIGVQIRNNYTSTISEISVLGKIPFEGNTYVLSEEELGSTYTAKMMPTGVELPAELRGRVTVYYSENETPNKDLNNTENGWKTSNQITNWDKIRTYLIDFGNTTIEKEKEYVFYYRIQIPSDLELNDISYSHHGVYFSLDTEEGKYKTQVEPSKIGLRIAQKYKLELTKYQLGRDKLVSGATYSIKEVDGDTVLDEGKTATTNEQGQLVVDGLYAEKTYEIQEIKTPASYEINADKVRYTTKADKTTGNISVEKLQGTTKEDMTAVNNAGEEQKVTVKVEDEVKGKLKLKKQDKETGNAIDRVYYQITGAGLPDSGKVFYTNMQGEINVDNLTINEEYTLQEVKATGYYLANPVKFQMTHNDGNYGIQINEGEVKETSTTEEDCVPTATVVLEDEKIPTYDLEITKVKRSTYVGTTTEENLEGATNEEGIEVLPGAKFKLYKDNKEIGTYVTDAEGKMKITGLYQYVEGKDIDATYTLKEVVAPTGYAKIKDITFKVEEKEGSLKFEATDETERVYTTEGNVLKLQIEDSSIFKLIKKDEETDEVIANTKFSIYNIENGEEPAKNGKGEILGNKEIIDGKEYYTIATNEKGEITADLQEGKYKAVEIQTPEKYQIVNTPYYFAIGSSEYETTLKTEYAKIQKEGINSLEDIYILKTSDGGYLVNDGGKVEKYNSEEEMQWTTNVGADNDTTSNNAYTLGASKTFIETKAGEYITFRNTTLTKFSNTGEKQWDKEVGADITAIAETEDGGCIMAMNGDNATIVKYNTSGDEEWRKEIISSDSCRGITQLEETKDGGIIIGICQATGNINLGENATYVMGSKDGFIIAKYNREGTIQWSQLLLEKAVRSLQETSDGGIIIGGSHSESCDNSEAMVKKYNVRGELQWEDTIQQHWSYTYARISSIIETTDGGYLAGGIIYGDKGVTLSNGQLLNTATDAYTGILIKYNAEGKVQRGRTILDTNNSQIGTIIETKNEEYLVGSIHTGSGGYNSYVDLGEIRILKPSSNFSMLSKYKITEVPYTQMQKATTIGGSSIDGITTMAKAEDGSYFAGGYFSSNLNLENGQTLVNQGRKDGMVIKYNREDEIEWARAIGLDNDDNIDCIIATEDGGCLAGGYSRNMYAEGTIVKYDKQGNIEWTKNIAENENSYVKSIEQTKDGGYLIGGFADESNQYRGVMIKYTQEGEKQWEKTIENTGKVWIESAIETKDGGYLVGGMFTEPISLENGIMLDSKAEYTAMIIKYNAKGEAEWAQTYATKTEDDEEDDAEHAGITMIETQEGDYVVGVNYFNATSGNNIDLGNNVSLVSYAGTYEVGILIKYNNKGEAQWARDIAGNNSSVIKSVEECKDGGYIIGGNYRFKHVELSNGLTLDKSNDYAVYDGFAVKYDSNGNAQWAKNIGGQSDDSVYTVVETQFGNYRIAGRFTSSTINLENGLTLNNTQDSDGMLIKLEESLEARQELEVFNHRKNFEITTKVEEVKGRKGGSISGEDKLIYETVKYGDSNTKEIKMTPDENYQILKITVNGKNYPFEKAEDGSYTMPTFTNITENKNIVVTYSSIDNTMTIHKVDSNTKAPLEGAEFTLQQAGEATVGNLTQSSTEDPSTITSGVISVNREYFVKQDEKYVPNNSMTYQRENGGTEGISNSVANSMCPINLSDKTGKYIVEVNASISSEQDQDIGYAIIQEQAGPIPTYDKEEGRFIYLSGEVEAKNYTYELEGGKMYFLFLGYRKNESGDVGEDRMVINSIKVCRPTHGFAETDGNYELNPENRTNNSYVGIDLTSNTGEYTLGLDASIASQGTEGTGYVSVTESETVPDYNMDQGTFVKITGNQETQHYTTTLEGGKKYYLHLGYDKEGNTLEGNTFTVSNLKVEPKEYKVTTNQEGKGSIEIPFGTYKVTETKAPEGYIINNEPIEFEFTAEGEHELTIENIQTSNVTVHHYKKGTEEKLADDEMIRGKEGEPYTTAPQMNLEGYTLDVDEEGKYIIPTNAAGRYTASNIEVDYEYVGKDIPLTVHHYIEGSTNKVPLANGNEAEDVVQKGKEGEAYTTSAIPDNELANDYELAKAPENSTGIYSGDEMTLTYYYKKLERDITINKYQEDGVTPLPGAKFTINNKTSEVKDETIYTTDEEGKIQITLGYGEYEITEVEAPAGYVLPENPVTPLIINKDLESTQVNIINGEERGTVVIHYYIEGTTTKVPLLDGNVAEDITKTGKIGEIYASKPLENISKKYELIEEPTNASGLITKEKIEVFYYYKAKETPIIENAEFTKTSGKDKIIKTDEKIPYTITYKAKVDKYKGDAVITIVDTLPYEIDVTEGKSNLAGGTYDKTNKTITWTETIEGIDTYTNGKKELMITKEIELTYKNLDSKQEKLSNSVRGEINFVDTDEKEPIEATTNDIPIDILKDIEVTLSWVDTEEQRGKRPEKLIIQIIKDGTVVDSKEITITEDDTENKVSFEDLPKYDEEGNLINYTVDEAVLPGEEHKDDLKYYEKTIEGSTITNTFTTDKLLGTISVQHIDKETNEIIKTTTKTGKVGTEIETTPEDIENYVLVEEPEQKRVIFTEEEQIVKYYYAHASLGVIEKHIDINTQQLIYSETHTGKEGDLYDIQAKSFEGYDLVEQDQDGNSMLPENAKGEMGKEAIEVKYYYSRKASVRVEYINNTTKEKLIEDVIINGHENEKYVTEKKDIEGYAVINEPSNKEGIMKVTENADGTYQTEIIVQYYYAKKSKGVKEQYIDIKTNKVVEEIIHEGNVGDEYIITPKEIEGYELVEKDEDGNSKLPTNTKGVMTEEEIVVQYYYIKKVKVVVKYMDKNSKEEIMTEEINGHEGDSYETKEKQIEGYELLEVPKNAKGIMGKDSIEVIYYYRGNAQIEVQYLDKETEEELFESEIIEGYAGDKYTTKEKEKEYYKLAEIVGNAKGTMPKGKTIIKYYFEKEKFNLRVDSWISKVTMNGIVQGGRTFTTKDDIFKLEMRQSRATTADIIITYKIKVSNDGEIDGSVEALTNIIPEGYKFYQTDNKTKWSNQEGVLTTTELQGNTIKVGESKEIELVLRREKGENNFGQKTNTVSITKVKNLAGYQDANKEDNVSKADMIITIITGIDTNDKIILAVSTIIIMTLALTSSIVGFIIIRKKHK